MTDKKNKELESYILTREFVNSHINVKTRKYFNSLIPISDPDFAVIQSERPDFVANLNGCSYAVEHFMVDICNDGPKNNQSQSKLANCEVANIYKRYHNPEIGTIEDRNICDAVREIEGVANRISNIPVSFCYEKYVASFKRSFEEHYSKIESYTNNKEICNSNIKVGFLIEFHCDTLLLYAMLGKSIVSFKGKRRAFPLTQEIAHIFGSASKLDFIIVSQFNEGVHVKAEDVRIYEPRNLKLSLDKQRITVYDKAFYLPIQKRINLNLEHE